MQFGDLLALLDAVAEERSLRGAADALRLSYRSVWGRILAYETALGQRLVIKTKGHGTGLSPTGERLLSALRAASEELRPAIAGMEARLQAELELTFNTSPRRYRVALSHDPLLIEAAQSLSDAFELSVMGSEDAMARLRHGAVDGAGFHGGTLAGRGRRIGTDLARIEVLPLFEREQGLMLAPGNPLGIASLTDLASTAARFVNRQKGSGTRAWFDRLLAATGIAPDSIRGYGTEEFTHGAVAAVVASGGADAGMGVRAAAEPLGLAFVPLGRETYFLALRSRAPVVDQLIDMVRDKVSKASGYWLPEEVGAPDEVRDDGAPLRDARGPASSATHRS